MNRQHFIKTIGALSLGALTPIVCGGPKKRYNLHISHVKKLEFARLKRDMRKVSYIYNKGFSDTHISEGIIEINEGKEILVPTFEIACNPEFWMTNYEFRTKRRDLYDHKNPENKIKAHKDLFEEKGILEKMDKIIDAEEEKIFDHLAEKGCKDIYKFIRQERLVLPCSDVKKAAIVYYEEIGVVGLV